MTCGLLQELRALYSRHGNHQRSGNTRVNFARIAFAGAGDERRSQLGTGDRSEKIRTYNFPDDRVTDHRIKLTVSGVPRVLEGELANMIETLRLTDQAERLRAAGLASN